MIYSAGAPWGNFLLPLGEYKTIASADAIKEHNKGDFLVLWGGADINPKLYNHKNKDSHGINQERDDREWAMLNRAIELDMPVIGVCRGAQMLCARAGGFLVQDVRNHAGNGNHQVITYDNKEFSTNSVHHQMMAGWQNLDANLLAWTKHRLSPTYSHDAEEYKAEDFVEPEIIRFNTIRGFGVQWHPEWMAEDSAATQFVLNNFAEMLV